MSEKSQNPLAFSKFLEDVKEMHKKPKPSLDEIWQTLGPFANTIKYHSIDLLDYKFFQKVGQPVDEAQLKRFSVEQVSSWSEAINARENKEIQEIEVQAIGQIDQLVEQHNRYKERDAVRALTIYYIKDSLSAKYDDSLSLYVPSDFRLALTEMVLTDVGKPTFFRERWTWYDDGHFPCGVKSDGTRVVY